MNTIRIQREDFDPGAEITALGEPEGEVGGIASFVGLVRSDGGLASLTLDHYPGFAEAEIATIVAEAERRWPLLGVRIVHRVGRLTPGERIVFCGAASTHRQAAFEAAEFLMDYLKTRAPFWKEEEREGSALRWVAARSEDDERVKRWR